MESSAKLKYAGIGPVKVMLIANEIREQSVDKALTFLGVMKNRKKAVSLVEKLLKSAVANFAVKEPSVDTEKIFIKKVFVDNGPMQKRIKARAQGRAVRRLKRSSHISVVLSD